jgi:hypothetical protein
MTKWVLPEGRTPLSNDWMRCIAQDFSSVSRVEVIDSTGRAYVNIQVSSVELSLQDDSTTLKIFIKE